MTTAIRYLGPFDEVEVPDLGITVKRNHKVDVDDDAAVLLVQQESWVVAEDKPTKPVKET